MSSASAIRILAQLFIEEHGMGDLEDEVFKFTDYIEELGPCLIDVFTTKEIEKILQEEKLKRTLLTRASKQGRIRVRFTKIKKNGLKENLVKETPSRGNIIVLRESSNKKCDEINVNSTETFQKMLNPNSLINNLTIKDSTRLKKPNEAKILGSSGTGIKEETDDSCQIDNVKEVPKESISTIKDILATHFRNGFRIDSPIELKRYRRFTLENYGIKLEKNDEMLREDILKAGLLYDNKVYIVSMQSKDKLRRAVLSAFDKGYSIIFYNPFYEKHESWLLDEGVASAEMLKAILKTLCPNYTYKRNYFTNNTNKMIDEELAKCFEQNIILSYEQLVEMLQYIPLATVKWFLSQNPDFIWNTVGKYTHTSKFKITEEEKLYIKKYAEEQSNRKGYLSLADLSIENIAERNNDLSVAAIHNAIFRICLDCKYERRGKIVTLRGVELDAFEITKQYCRTLERCTLEDLLAFEKELTGEVHHWASMGAAYSEMVRIDATTFVAQELVEFDVGTIDAVLDDFCLGDYIPLLSVTTFVAFPHVRQPWTHFLLESYVRRFSQKYRFEVLSVNSKNCGAIVRKNCKLSYREIMADAVAKSNIALKQKVVLEFLYTNGYIGKRSVSGISSLISQAKLYREGEL